MHADQKEWVLNSLFLLGSLVCVCYNVSKLYICVECVYKLALATLLVFAAVIPQHLMCHVLPLLLI